MLRPGGRCRPAAPASEIQAPALAGAQDNHRVACTPRSSAGRAARPCAPCSPPAPSCSGRGGGQASPRPQPCLLRPSTPAGPALAAARSPPASDLLLRAVESLLNVLSEDARLHVGHGCAAGKLRGAERRRAGAGVEEQQRRGGAGRTSSSAEDEWGGRREQPRAWRGEEGRGGGTGLKRQSPGEGGGGGCGAWR